MKKYFTLLSCFAAMIFYGINLAAQWCIPETAIPYAPSMPGITHVTLNTIDRSSPDLEDYPNNSYVYAEETTTLVKGVTYEMTIKFTVDAAISPDMNIRVWIDLDQDGSFDDIGETVLSTDHVDPTEFVDEFYLPDYALPGLTRMRVTAKMSNLGGHSLPTPCDVPQDPLGYHGEFEDYDITISNATAIDEIDVTSLNVSISPNPASDAIDLAWQSNLQTPVAIQIVSLNGSRIIEINEYQFTNNGNTIHIDLTRYQLSPGCYIVSVVAGNKVESLNLIVAQ